MLLLLLLQTHSLQYDMLYLVAVVCCCSSKAEVGRFDIFVNYAMLVDML